MTIVISSETQKLLEERLKGGQYASTDELLHAALAALYAHKFEDMDPEILAAIDRAEEAVAQGSVHDWQDVREKVRGRLLN